MKVQFLNMDIDNLKEVILLCNSRNEVFSKMKLSNASGNYKSFNRLIKENNIDISHFRDRSEEALHLYNKGVLQSYENSDIFVDGSTVARSIVKKRIIRDELIEYKCIFCNNMGEWKGQKLVLILDHINGIREDNRLENLRFLCPNCNSTLETHCKGSKGLIEKVDKREEYFKRRKINYLETQKENIEKVNMSQINFSKLGWVIKVSEIIGISSQKTGKWLEKCMPEIYENAYIRKSSPRK